MKEAFGLTIPQLEWSLGTLSEVKKLEGGGEEESDSQANTQAAEATLKVLMSRTGRKTFSLDELEDPTGTIRKYQEGLNHE